MGMRLTSAPRAALAASIVATILAGCATTSLPGSPVTPSTTASPSPSATARSVALPPGSARRWILVQIGDRDALQVAGAGVATLDLGRSGEVSGSDGCVGFGGRIASFAAPDDPAAGAHAGPTVGIRIGDLIHTMQACVPDTAVTGYLDALGGAQQLSLVGDTLYLWSDGIGLKFRVDRAVTVDPPTVDG